MLTRIPLRLVPELTEVGPIVEPLIDGGSCRSLPSRTRPSCVVLKRRRPLGRARDQELWEEVQAILAPTADSGATPRGLPN